MTHPGPTGTYVLDAKNHLASAGGMAYLYDGAGELTSATDPLGNPATSSTYDGFGNLIKFKDPLSRTVSETADAVGRTQSVAIRWGKR